MSGKPVILVVDDEKNTREGLARALRGEYEVAEAENGLRALEWLETQVADVVLSDKTRQTLGVRQSFYGKRPERMRINVAPGERTFELQIEIR